MTLNPYCVLAIGHGAISALSILQPFCEGFYIFVQAFFFSTTSLLLQNIPTLTTSKETFVLTFIPNRESYSSTWRN